MLIGNILLVSMLLTQIPARSQSPTPSSQRMADAFLTWHPDSSLIGSRKTARWDYEQGLMLKALERVWQRTGEAKYFTYLRHDLDQFVRPDGSIRTYQAEDYNLDNLATGRALLLLAQTSAPDQAKYAQAAKLLRRQLDGQPRTEADGFWHKKI